jgi:hypothetical protein
MYFHINMVFLQKNLSCIRKQVNLSFKMLRTLFNREIMNLKSIISLPKEKTASTCLVTKIKFNRNVVEKTKIDFQIENNKQ